MKTMRKGSSKMKTTLQAFFLILLVVGSVYVVRKANAPLPYRTFQGKVFGTTFHITYASHENLERQILAELHKVDGSLSMFNTESTISKINANRSMATDPMFREVFTLAQRVSTETDGAFDITVGPLVNAWGFGFKHKDTITDALIDSLLAAVDYRGVRIDNGRVVKNNKATVLDCSAIAKGYGVDCVARVLRENGVKNFMVEIGGEIVTQGVNSEGAVWTIGIVNPSAPESSTNESAPLQEIIKLNDRALATSGNYRNFYMEGERKFAHTIHPKTGRPVEHSLLSATVIAATCAEADAYATAFMVMGLDSARAFVERNADRMDAYLIYADSVGENCVWHSAMDNLLRTDQ